MTVIGVICAMASLKALAWGETAHGILASVGATVTSNGQGFYQANAAQFAHLSTVPDIVWKSGTSRAGERPNHWFQVDFYYPSCNINDIAKFPKSYQAAVTVYSQSTVLTQGTAPWRIRQFYSLAVQALKNGQPDQALQYMGVMSHYVGDLSQPLHDTQNYDGALTSADGKSTGIHAFFESKNISASQTDSIATEVQNQAQALLADPRFTAQFEGDLMDVIFHEVARAVAERDTVLNNDAKYGRTGQGATVQLALAINRMADGAATLALILDHLYADAGISQSYGGLSTVADPSWVTPDFSNETPWFLRASQIQDQPAEDDCLSP